MPVAKGWLRVSHRELDPDLSLPYRPYHKHTRRLYLEPGEIVRGRRWRSGRPRWCSGKGHRIRLDIQPRDGVGSQSYMHYHADYNTGTNTIYAGGEQAVLSAAADHSSRIRPRLMSADGHQGIASHTVWHVLTHKNVLAGLMFVAIAIFGLWVSRDYPIGTALRMGTGYVPRLLCWGPARARRCSSSFRACASRACAPRASAAPWGWRALVFVTASLVIFGLAIEAARPRALHLAAHRHRRAGGARPAAARDGDRRAGADRAVLGDLHRRARADDPGLAGVVARWSCSHNLAIGFGVAMTPANLGFAFVGAMVGTLIGVLPGIGPIATIAMLLPLTFHLEPISGLIMLAGIFYGAQYGGSTTAILVNLPGETSSVVTCIDGHQMARQGRAGAALAVAALGSFFAGCVSTALIATFAPPLAKVGQSFGSPEYFSLMVLGLIAAVVLAHGSVVKAVAMIILGLLIGLVGTDGNTGGTRFTFGIRELTDGIDVATLAIGLFGVGEIITNLSQSEQSARSSRRRSRACGRPARISAAPGRRCCAARRSARFSACCPAAAPR